MRLFLYITFILFLTIGDPFHVVLAETTDANRTVADSLHEDSSTVSLEEEVEIEEEVFTQPSMVRIFLQLIAALLFIVFLIYLLLRFVTKRTQSYESTKILQNLGGVQLGPNRSIQLIKAGDRLLIVGVGETIQLLKEIEDEDEITYMIAQNEEQLERLNEPFTSFTQLVRNLKRPKTTDHSSTSRTDDTFKTLLSEQLEDVSTSQAKLREIVRERDK